MKSIDKKASSGFVVIKNTLLKSARTSKGRRSLKECRELIRRECSVIHVHAALRISIETDDSEALEIL